MIDYKRGREKQTRVWCSGGTFTLKPVAKMTESVPVVGVEGVNHPGGGRGLNE